jgi:hypothetical protein
MPSIFFKLPDQKEFELAIKRLDDVQETNPVMARIAGIIALYLLEAGEGSRTPYLQLGKLTKNVYNILIYMVIFIFF